MEIESLSPTRAPDPRLPWKVARSPELQAAPCLVASCLHRPPCPTQHAQLRTRHRPPTLCNETLPAPSPLPSQAAPLSSPLPPALPRTSLSLPRASRPAWEEDTEGCGRGWTEPTCQRPPALPSPPPPSQPFQASPLPAPHQPSPVPTPARHPRGLRTRGGGREADPEQGGSNWEALWVCREKLRVLGSLCGHACSGDRGNPIGVPAGAEGGFARVCVCVCVCVCVYV